MINHGIKCSVLLSKVGYLDWANVLRVLLVKNPDISTPMFLWQYLFGCIIKSTHPGGLPKVKSWDLGASTVPWEGNQVLGQK